MTTGELRRILIPAGWLNHTMISLPFPACTSEYSSRDIRMPRFSCIWLIEAKKRAQVLAKTPRELKTPLILLYLSARRLLQPPSVNVSRDDSDPGYFW